MPHSTSAPRLGDLERVVMEHLWEAGGAGGPGFEGATVREVLDLGVRRSAAPTQKE